MAQRIDLRSDTVTLPTPAMREAMARAELGDDVYGEDPTVNALEERGAALLGKEAGLFVPTGTMGNLVATTTHCRPGDSVILGEISHIFLNEVGGLAQLGGLVAHTLPDTDGSLDPERVAAAIRPESLHTPGTRLICIENTHNFAGGVVTTPGRVAALRAVAASAGIPIHLDGARIFNAAVALQTPVDQVAAAADSVSFCFSKGLAAPVGSLLVGSATFIERARRKRKQYGGGMRQAGVLAAAALVALDCMVERLAEDHVNAQALVAGLAGLPGIRVYPETVHTNIVMADLADEQATTRFYGRLREAGVLSSRIGPRRLRFVTHFGVTGDDITQVIEVAASASGG